jgi:lysophospholipase L1-like esterase
MKKIALVFAWLLTGGVALAQGHWVGTWGTAPQLVENNNNPPSPGLGNNSLRQIVQVSIGGERVRLKLTNEFSTGSTQIKAVELAVAKTAGSSSEIDESTTVSLTFDGQAGVTMPAKGKAVSDPVDFKIGPRENVAITIHYGSASSTSVSGHPGSRTTSYLKSGNTTNFSGATKTDHWYNILALEVEAPEEAGAVAILGNSITDGRGSTTNQQNRWADVLSRRLLDNEPTSQVGVLNMGIGGNCVLGGGLGPTASSRYQRDLLGQEGVKWIILFEAVNDLGGAGNGVQTAKRIIDVYKQIIREAHEKGIYVFGGTITPFKGNSYYSADHEKGRSTINKWIRTTKMLDGVIDFDEAVRNPLDPEAMQSKFLFENDWLHLNAQGYETMGGCVDLSLFTKTDPVSDAEDEEEPYDNNAVWIEAEDLPTEGSGTAFQLDEDATASKGKYLQTVVQTTNTPTDSVYIVAAHFTVSTADTYYIYGRVMCPSWDDDSYFVSVDGALNSNFVNGLQTASWDWKELYHGNLKAGEHTLYIGSREDGACLDKLCITTNPEAPSGMGGTAVPTSITLQDAQESPIVSTEIFTLSGVRLTAQPTEGVYIEVRRAEDGSVLSRKVVVKP